MTGRVVVLSAPSGGGKTTIARALLERRADMGWSVSATTRPPRSHERDGVDYHFLSREEFLRRRDAGEFLEWDEHFGNLYGTLRAEVDRIVRDGRHAILDIDVEGARQVRERRRDVLSIFILPPSAEVLVDRLGGRRSENPEAIRRRLERASKELEAAAQYDRIVVNDDLDEAVGAVEAIVDGRPGGSLGPDDAKAVLDELRRNLRRLGSPS